jgi:hypothetical protein
MWGSFIPYSMPVYPGAIGPTPFRIEIDLSGRFNP